MKIYEKAIKRFVLYVTLLIGLVSSTAISESLSVEDVIKEVSPAVVKIIVYNITGSKEGVGSGFFINSGEIVTNAHVMENAYSAEVQSCFKTYKNVTIMKRDDEIDLALLTVEDDFGEQAISLADKNDLRPGQRIIAIGNPLGLERTVSDGLISAVRGVPGQLQLIQISAPISPGSSGGPLLNSQGSVIGVTSAGMSEGQNLNFAIGIVTLKQFLQQTPNPEVLKEAGSRVLWRSILKWIGNTVLLILALALGGGWWIIFIVIMVVTFLFYILKGLCKFISTPFRRKAKSDISCADEEPYVTTTEDTYTKQTSLFEEDEELEEKEEDIDEDNFSYFYCWKCGELVEIDKSTVNDTVRCEGCGTIIKIPKD